MSYATADEETLYILKPSSNKADDYEGIHLHTDEKIAVISGHEPKEFLEKQNFSYQYEVDKKDFKPNISLDGRFTGEYESDKPADVLDIKKNGAKKLKPLANSIKKLLLKCVDAGWRSKKPIKL